MVMIILTRPNKAIFCFCSLPLWRKERQKSLNDQLDTLGQDIDQRRKIDIHLQQTMQETAGILSDAILTAKFIQTIPIVGIVGGAVNYHISRKSASLLPSNIKNDI